MSNRIDEIDGVSGDSSSNRSKAWEMARQFQRKLNSNENNAQNTDTTNNRRDSSLIENSAQKNQEVFNESYDESGSISGGYNAGSTILAAQQSEGGSGDFGGGSGSRQHQPKGDSVKMESKKLKESNLKKMNVKLFDD